MVGGWLPGEGNRAGRIGALLVGYHDDDGKLRYAGRVGTGFTEAELLRLRDLLAPLARDTSPFEGRQPPRAPTTCAPSSWPRSSSASGRTTARSRHPPTRACARTLTRATSCASRSMRRRRRRRCPTQGESTPASRSATRPRRRFAAQPARAAAAAERVEVEVEGSALSLSNLDKVLYPQAGFTKGDVIDYYARIAPVAAAPPARPPADPEALPRRRRGQFFYEKQCPSHRPDWVRTAPVITRSENKTSTSAWSTTCRRWCGSPTSRTSSCTPRSRTSGPSSARR